MKNRGLVLFLSCLLVLVIGAGAIIGILALNDNKDDNEFKNLMKEANNYVADENWEEAINCYIEAIKCNDTDEDAYYRLAEIYIYQGRMDEAREILEEGIEKTDSDRLRELYDRYFGEENDDNSDTSDKKVSSDELSLNTALLSKIASYKYEKYVTKFGNTDREMDGDTCNVVHRDLDGVTFLYYDIPENENIVNEDDEKPFDNAMPAEAIFDSASTLVSGIDGEASFDELSELNVKNIEQEFNDDYDKETVYFEAEKCYVYLECDEDGNVKEDAWALVIPKYGNEADNSNEEFEVSGNVVSATTGSGVSGATITVWERDNTISDAILTTETDSTGGYEFELPEGEYTARIECEEFITEDIDFEVDKWGESDIEQLVISQELEEGQIRIVLEWGAYPTDLDSHFKGKTSDGDSIYINYTHKYEAEANLDVDDTTSYGPETVTVLDINGEYEYFVHDYLMTGNMNTSDATVKVYIPGKSTPIVYEIPVNLEGNDWYVFKIKNGEVVDY